MKLKVKPCKYCNEHAIEMSRCPDINPMEPVRMLEALAVAALDALIKGA